MSLAGVLSFVINKDSNRFNYNDINLDIIGVINM